MSYENPWIYNEEVFESSHIQDWFGFVYHIYCPTTGRRYVGRKYFWRFRTPKGKCRKVKSESDWKQYYGSCPELKEDVKKYGKECFERKILSLHKTKGKCNFEETRQLFLNNVLTEALDSGVPAYYNSNILNRYFRKDYFDGYSRTDSSDIT